MSAERSQDSPKTEHYAIDSFAAIAYISRTKILSSWINRFSPCRMGMRCKEEQQVLTKVNTFSSPSSLVGRGGDDYQSGPTRVFGANEAANELSQNVHPRYRLRISGPGRGSAASKGWSANCPRPR